MSARLLAALALVLCGCTVSGTGVALTIEGNIAPDAFMVIASYNGRSISRRVTVPPSVTLPTTLLAELPDQALQVTFDVTAYAGSTELGRAMSMPVDVKPHQIGRVTVRFDEAGDGSMDGLGDGPDLAGDGPFSLWRRQKGGLAPLAPNAVTGIWGAAAGDVYATSKFAGNVNLLHTDDQGAVWSGSYAASTEVGLSLNGVWGASPTEVFLVGEGGVILKGSGTTWVTMPSPAPTTVSLNGVWGTSATNAFAVGSGNTLLHLSGGGWLSRLAVGATVLHAVWGSGASDIYAVGSGGTILHSIGTATWSPQTSNVTVELRGIWGTGPNDIYVVGDGGTILHSIGNGIWTKQTNGVPAVSLESVWGSSAGDIWAVGSSWTILKSSGLGSWTSEPNGLTVDNATTNRFLGVWGSGVSDVYAVGAGQTILHRP